MVKLFYTVIVLLLALATTALAEPSCDIVPKRLAPCYSYIQGKYHAIKPSGRCCRGLTDIAQMEKNGRKDSIAVCKCIKRALLHINYDPNRIKVASQQCNTEFALPAVGHNTTCELIL
ncbi:non-specific lipid-transfer protein-like [Lycium barbarum]|uniref:non-specific lipid-transfer protein-like n=1 Tax=Lycium ferocissimum TaxID=112874 RepID=UPI002815F788|nr:non-specific lipid-transfer protein-like [Lycium ferocissimum]XP_060216954.1 non-specific lipid-transfer protein-like [Lycium barbarum]